MKSQPKYDVVISESGETVSNAIPQSPIPLRVMKSARQNATLMQLLERGRRDDLIAHRLFMIQRGPELEKQFGVSAREIFVKGDAKQAMRLQSVSPDAYDELHEYSYFL